MSKLKWIAGVAAVLILVMSVPGTSEAGRRFSGADPIFVVDGYRFNVRIEWPSEYDCDINGPIKVHVKVPASSSVEFIAESSANHSGCIQETSTTIEEYRKLLDRKIYISAKVPSGERFTAIVKADVQGEMFRERDGRTNRWINLPGISMLEVGLMDLATGLDGEEGELNYTYDEDEYDDQHYTEDFVEDTLTEPVSTTTGLLGRTTGLLFGR